MIIILKKNSTKEEAQEIIEAITETGLKPLYLPGIERVVIGAIGDERLLKQKHFDSFPQVETVKEVLAPYKLVSREMKPETTQVFVKKRGFGGHQFQVIAGPCAVEDEAQVLASAKAVKAAGATLLRGGAYKPRTSPYSFQGLGMSGLRILASVGKEVDLPVVTEVLEVGDVEAVATYADVLQVGARNMQNFQLLKTLGQARKPVILKRGMAAKVEDLLLAAEYMVAEGNDNVILCERGIRTFETSTRNTLDLSAVPYIKAKSHLPVIVDPSHGTGVRDLVAPMAYAAAACGADGVMIEVHPDPAKALSDGMQSLYPQQFADLMVQLKKFVLASGREMA